MMMMIFLAVVYTVLVDSWFIVRYVNQIKYIIAGDDDDEVIELGKHPLFTQMDVLCHFDDGRIGWKQISRYENEMQQGIIA
jgi:hypothetical protein